MDISTEGPVEKKTCIVVDEEDNALFIGGLAKCHIRPMTLHRAFSLFVFDEAGRLLLQQRAKTKYTFPLAWTNTVCSHPRTQEKSMEEWIDIRVKDELGWAIKDIRTRLRPVGKLTYSATSDFTYGEKEVDTLYVVQVSEAEKEGLAINRDEVEAIDWVEPARLESILADDRQLVTPWFRAIANGFGHPFFEQICFKAEEIAARAAAGPASGKGGPADGSELPQEVTSTTTTGQTAVVTFVEPSTGQTLPWFRVGNCSMPRANSECDLLLQGPFSYLSSNPGKALRTELVKLYADIDAQVTTEDVEGLAWVVERVHTASLLHDDIEDRSATRRGAVCAYKLWGTAHTINTGTFNFLRAAQGVDEQLVHRDEATRSRVMRAVLNMELDLHRGQNADICWGEHALCPTVAEYLEMVDNKTGALFMACATLGAACSGNKDLGDAVATQFKQLGRFFQVRDDLCNICDPAYWKAKGFYEDADEGKYSYPVLAYFDKAARTAVEPVDDQKSAEDGEASPTEWLRERLANHDKPMELAEKLRAYDLLFASNALHETREYCQSKLVTLRGSSLRDSPRTAAILDMLYLPEVLTPEEVRAVLSAQA